MWVQQERYVLVGAVLAAARRRAGLTQQQLARRIRKPQSFVSSMERGQRRIDVLELIRVAEGLQVDPRKLFAAIVSRKPA